MPEHPSPKLRPIPPPPAAVEPAMLAYAELDVTTNFSFLRGASHPDELVNRAAELGYRALAVTDVNSLAGVVRAHEAAKAVDLTLIIGARLTLSDGPDLLVWAPDRRSYGKLCRLLTVGKRRAEKGQCLLTLEDVAKHHEGLLAAIALTSEQAKSASGMHPTPYPSQGEGWGEGRDEELEVRSIAFGPLQFDPSPLPSSLQGRGSEGSPIDALRDLFGNRLSLAASSLYGSDDLSHLRHLQHISRRYNIPLLATNHVHYHDPSRRMLQDVLSCIRHGCTIQEAGFRLFPNGERYLKSPEQVYRLFADFPRAIHRGIEIAEQCSFSLDELRYEYPKVVVPEGKTSIQYLTHLVWSGAADRYPSGIPGKVRRQIAEELVLIEQLKIEPYFLTVFDIITFARNRGILCQGRGSAANSAVCYCLGITAVDPAVHDLLFARFVSAARNEPPDIDVDFEHERREEVIQYIYQKYGRDRAGMTATVITYHGRSAVRDIGKALGLSLDTVDALARRLDGWHRGTIEESHLREAGVDPRDPNIRRLAELTTQVLGFPRHLSQHTGGMVMTHGPLCELVPIENASMEDRTVIEWDKDDIDALGILKVDVLALGMLTCLAKALESISTRRFPLHLHTLPPEDPAVYDMICDADTVGVFQIESRAQMSMLPRLRPRCFGDLTIEVAIVRPGPIQGDMVHPYLRRRNGEEPVSYPSEEFRQVLEKTLGVPLFQEQAMRVVMVAAGFSAEEADRLRRAMAAWRRSGAIEQFHRKVVEGMVANGYSRAFAEQTFHQIRGFGEYGFPESHAASFAMLVYASAWIKRYHPAAFAAALLNSQPMGFYAPAQIVRDAREHGVEVRPTDVNESEWDCSLESDEATERPSDEEKQEGKQSWGLGGPALRLGLRRIKGLAQEHADLLMNVRQTSGRFESIEQLHERSRIPKHALVRLAEADAFGSLGLARRQALWQVLRLSDERYPLFEAPSDFPLRRSVASSLRCSDTIPLPPMPEQQEVKIDYSTTGLSLKNHPVALVREQLNAMKIVTARDFEQMDHGRWVKVAGLVLIRQRPGTASGVVFVTLEDETGVVNLILWPRTYERYRATARHAGLMGADGYVERQGKVIYVVPKRLHDLSYLLDDYTLNSRDFH